MKKKQETDSNYTIATKDNHRQMFDQIITVSCLTN